VEGPQNKEARGKGKETTEEEGKGHPGQRQLAAEGKAKKAC